MALPAFGADSSRPGRGYVAAFIGASIPADSIISTDDFSGSRTYRDTAVFDPGLYMGGTAGYDFGFLRMEGEVSYRKSEMQSITDTANGSRFRNSDGNLEMTAFMANAFINLANNSPVIPYLGGGVGFAVLHLSDTYGTSARSGSNSGSFSRSRLYDDGDDTVFAYQFGGGIEIAINRRYSLDFGYRFFKTDPATFNRNTDWVNSLRFESHNALAGFKAKF
ncbi:MAG TPA: porin family protein [Desulfuromonadales bacterium]|nr:porin family protein [Desulfuromonadales bacterium]